MAVKIVDVSNPAAIGMEWEQGESRFQLVFPVDGDHPMFGARFDGGEWRTMMLVAPERFGKYPKTRKEAREYTERYISWPE